MIKPNLKNQTFMQDCYNIMQDVLLCLKCIRFKSYKVNFQFTISFTIYRGKIKLLNQA